MGVYLSQPNTEKISQEGSHQNLKFAATSMQGWRTNMEDSHIADLFVNSKVQVFGVFDGHGGKEVAAFVEKHFIEELKQNENFKNEHMEKALEETFLKIDILLSSPEGKKELQIIKSGGNENDGAWNSESYAGCTANVALLHNYKDLYIANAGDSRCVISENGEVRELSEDHKPELKSESDRVKNAGGYITEGRINGNLNLSRALGDLEYKKNEELSAKEQLIIAFPEVRKRTLTANDEFILMGCDGIWETKSNQEIITFCRDKMKQGLPLKKVLEDLLDDILAPDTATGVGCDNMTSLIVTFKNLN